MVAMHSHSAHCCLFMLFLGLLVHTGCRRGDAARAGSQPPPAVIVSTPIKRDVTVYHEYTGNTHASESVEIRARVQGYLDSIHFQDGAEVKEGDLLFVIDPRPYQA